MVKPIKVIDFDPKVFHQFIEKMIEENVFEDPLLIIGIEEGGKPLAEMMTMILQEKKFDVAVEFVKCQRPTTSHKKKNLVRQKSLKTLFKFLPKSVLNQLRIWEHQRLMKPKNVRSNREVLNVEHIHFEPYHQIWVLDDAVDTGQTLKTVVNALHSNINKKVKLQTLVVTTTADEVILAADYSLYRGVLVRFPWSLDG